MVALPDRITLNKITVTKCVVFLSLRRRQTSCAVYVHYFGKNIGHLLKIFVTLVQHVGTGCTYQLPSLKCVTLPSSITVF